MVFYFSAFIIICRAFTKDDDTRLREAVKMYGESRWSLGECIGVDKEKG